MNENEYYWEDRFLDVLRRFDDDFVKKFIAQRMEDQINEGVCPALRIAIALDRPDIIAPVLQKGGDGVISLADVTWENEELVRLLITRTAAKRLGETPLAGLIRRSDAKYLQAENSNYAMVAHRQYWTLSTILCDIATNCPYEQYPNYGLEWLPILEAVLATGVIRKDDGGEAWHDAFHGSVKSGHLEAAQAFLRHGADPNLLFLGKSLGLIALEHRHAEIYEALVSAGAEVAWDTEGTDGKALWYTAQNGMLETSHAMLADALASGNLTVDELMEFFDRAMTFDHTELAELFLDTAVDIYSESRESFLSKCHSLINAASDGEIERFEYLLELGPPGGEAILNAALCNTTDFYPWMLARGIDIDAANFEGKTFLMAAASRSVREAPDDVLDLILSHSPNIDLVSHDGSTALSLAVEYPDAVKRLLDAGADPNAGFGRTPLMLAAECNYQETMELLLEAGANVNTTLLDGETAWRIADRHGHEDIAKLLDAAGAQEPDISRTDLRAAILWRRTDDALRLIDAGVDIEITDTQGRTPLLAAIQEDCDRSVVERLLDRGAGLNFSFIKDGECQSALTLAAERIRPDVVQLLLDRGANVRIEENNCGPLSAAVSAAFYNYDDELHLDPTRPEAMDICRRILEAGASPNIYSYTEHLLTVAGPKFHNDIDIMRLLVEHGADLNVRSASQYYESCTVLYDACGRFDVEAVQFLLEHGADPNAISSYGRFPLCNACHTPNWIEYIYRGIPSDFTAQNYQRLHEHDERVHRIVKLLLDYGADLHIKQNRGRHSVLRLARHVCILTEPRRALIKLLVDAGAPD